MYRLMVGPILLLALAASPAAAQTTLNLSQDLVPLGIASTNMVPNQPAIDAGPLLYQGIEYAKQHGTSHVIADPGAYYFLSLSPLNPTWHVGLLGLHNVTVDLQGSDLTFSNPLATGLYLGYSDNVVYQNFKIDYQPLPFTQVRVVSVNPATAQIQYALEPGWQNPSDLNAASAEFVEVHLFRNGQPAYGTRRMAAQRPISGNALTIVPYDVNPTPANMSRIRPGDIAVVSMRSPSAPAINADRCVHCTFRNISVYFGASGAIQTYFSSSSTLERIYSIPKPGTDRLMSTGGIGTETSGPGATVRLSRAIRTWDDGFGLFNWVTGLVQSQGSARTLSVAGVANTSLSWIVSVPDGSTVTFQQADDGSILGSAVVVSQTAGPISAQPYVVTYTFDRDLPAGLVNSYMYPTDPALRGANSLVERNLVQSNASCCTGIDLGGWASNSTVHGNYMRAIAWAAIMANQHLEISCCDDRTVPLVNVAFSNNVIDGANLSPARNEPFYSLGAIEVSTLRTDPHGVYDPMPTSPHQNLTFINNFIADAGRSALWVGNTAGGSVTGNYLLHAGERPNLADEDPAYVQDATVPLVIEGTSNGIGTSNNVDDHTSGRLFVTDTQYRELAAYAPGATIRLNAYGVGGLPSPVLTLTDADGQTRTLTIQNTATHALDVQIPAATALGGAYVTLTSGVQKTFGTLFVDSQDNVPAVNGCTYELSPSSTSVPGTASTLPILVVTQAGCAYPVLATDPFVTISGGTGTGVVNVGFARNPGPPRSTTIEIAGQPLTVTQEAVGLAFYTLSPCRVLDTRNANGPLGGPALAPHATRIFPAAASSCGIPASASALAVNFTVTRPAAAGSLSADAGDRIPGVPTVISFRAGQTRAANGIVGLATDGSGTIAVTNNAAGTVHLIVDVVGYFQ